MRTLEINREQKTKKRRMTIAEGGRVLAGPCDFLRKTEEGENYWE